METVVAMIALLVGVALSALATWLVLRGRISLASQQAQMAGEAERATLTERARGLEQTLADVHRRLADQAAECQKHELQAAELDRQLAQAKTLLLSERREHQEKLALLEDAKKNLADSFKALAAEALNSNSQSFIELAKSNLEKFQETAKGDLEKRQMAIDQLVKPVRESLDKFDTKIQELEKARVGAYTGLIEQVQSLIGVQQDLRAETTSLSAALRAPNIRGRWGEMSLRNVVELAGMQNRCDFFEQESVDTDDGRLRPDMLVRLPGNKTIIVDAKVPLAKYLEASEATDNDVQQSLLEQHAEHVREHITALSRKAYHEQFDQSPEFVVLYIPGESFLYAAMRADPTIMEFAAARRVHLAAPTTLMTLLRTAAFGWRDEELAKNAQEISRLGKELYDRCCKFGEKMSKAGDRLKSAVDAFNDAVGSFESRLLPSARKFGSLQSGGETNELKELTAIETMPRRLQAPELLADDKQPIEPLLP